ncbi:MAG: response regulator [Alphaproteobacteria bacterium]|nr:response regulator [Alphaproteobacteria bacterium]MBN9498274.1 response regulator [Alphaproteobacteria bacterium]
MNSTPTPKTILILDDDRTWREIATAVLEKRGFAVVAAETLDEALAEIDKGMAPAVAIVDLVMPRENGIQAVASIRKRSRNIAILGMSGNFDSYRAGGSAMRLAGADEILAKQAGPAELAAAVERLAIG